MYSSLFLDSTEDSFVDYKKLETIYEKTFGADDDCKMVKYTDIFNEERYAVIHNKTNLMLYRNGVYYKPSTPLGEYSQVKALSEYSYCSFSLKHNLGTRRFCTMGEYIISENEIVQVPYMVIYNHDLSFWKMVVDNKFLMLFYSIELSKRDKIPYYNVLYNNKKYKAYKLPALTVWGLYNYLISIQASLDGIVNVEDFFESNVNGELIEKDFYNEDEVYEGVGRDYLDPYVKHNIFKQSVEYHKAFGYFKYYPPISAPVLVKNIGKSQYRNGVRIEERFFDLYNPPNTDFYVKRGKRRKIKILFNEKIFTASYVYENQTDTTYILQRISFKKDIINEFGTIFPEQKGKFTIQQGVDINHFTFLPITEHLNVSENIINITSEEAYQQRVENIVIDCEIIINDKPEEKTKSKGERTSERWERDAKKAKRAITLAGYCCEVNKAHRYFISNKTKMNYVEAHHLIPMEFQDNFEVSIDIEANIVSLCTVCHAKLHHASFKEKIDVLTKLFEDRKDRLQSCGIKLELDDLLYLYGKC